MREGEPGTTSFRYNSYNPGSLRLIAREPLLFPESPMIDIIEWSNLKLETNPTNTRCLPRYAAISHVWKSSDEVNRIASEVNRPIQITIEDGRSAHEISWHGLIQAATAAKFWNCDYIWLDLLCVNQLASDDKCRQVQIMPEIYKNATAVLVMFGGCAAAQGLECPSEWINRAWTLQESTLNMNTFALVDIKNIPHMETHDRCTIANVSAKIERRPGNIGILNLPQLLKIDIEEPLGLIQYDQSPEDFWPVCDFKVKCFGNNPLAVRALNIVFHGLHSERTNAEIMHSAAWMSLWMRTSSKPQDMIFSIMHLLGVEIQVDYRRTVENLYFELVDKCLSTPAWLSVAPLVDIIPGSGLVPALPTFSPQALPTYSTHLPRKLGSSGLIDNGQLLYATEIVLHSTSSATGFEVCGTIMNVHTPRESGNLGMLNDESVLLSFSTAEGHFGSNCFVIKQIGKLAVFVGQTWQENNSTDENEVSIIFIDQVCGDWEKVGQGIVTLSPIEKSRLCETKRRHLQVGKDKASSEMKPCDCWAGKKKGQFRFVDQRLPGKEDHGTEGKRTESRVKETGNASPLSVTELSERMVSGQGSTIQGTV
jgi:hypothetical protein